MQPDRGEVGGLHVLSIPAGHVYTAAVRPSDVTVAPDPEDGWHPHPALDPLWWHRVSDAELPDLVHLHFGFDHLSVEDLRAFTATLRRRGVPLVLTVHNLDNPHVTDQADYHDKLGVLLDAAAARITLTDAAARHLPADTRVIPHPRVVEDPPRATGTGTAIGVFLKSLRTNVIADPVFYRIVGRVVHRATGQPLRVHLHEDSRTAHLTHALSGPEVADIIDLRSHTPLPDDALYRAVGQCGTVLLPYLRGTHSGWLEMCRDLGVSVAVPDCGMYADQVDDSRAVEKYATGDPLAAARALIHLHEQGPLPYTGDRGQQLTDIRRAHREVYREVSGR